MEPEDVPRGKRIATGVHRDHRAGWRSVIQCRVSFPGIGYCQKQVAKWWSDGTPVETMSRWRTEAKPRITAELQEKIDAVLRELAELKAAKPTPKLNPKTPAASYVQVKEELEAAQRQIVDLKETAAKLHEALRMERRRAELAEQSSREVASRAYRGFAAAGARR
jgi:hypothetical protein